MLPPAPGRLSTMMLLPIAAVIFSASMRAIRSPALPGGKGTTKRIGFEGYGCAAAAKEASERRNESASRFTRPSLMQSAGRLAPGSQHRTCDAHDLFVGVALDEPRDRKRDVRDRLGPEDRRASETVVAGPEDATDDHQPAGEVDPVARAGHLRLAVLVDAEEPERKDGEHREKYDRAGVMQLPGPGPPPCEYRQVLGRSSREQRDDERGKTGDDRGRPVPLVIVVLVAAIGEKEERQRNQHADEDGDGAAVVIGADRLEARPGLEAVALEGEADEDQR